jgi:hypothetical protein
LPNDAQQQYIRYAEQQHVDTSLQREGFGARICVSESILLGYRLGVLGRIVGLYQPVVRLVPSYH